MSLKAAGLLTGLVHHKGLWHVAKQVGRVVEADQECIVPIGHLAKFRFLLKDPYWSRLICPGFQYEPEIAQFLINAASHDYDFYDCGANFGYWSSFCSDTSFKNVNVVAVEANPITFRWLKKNQCLNENRFASIHRALYWESDKILYINGVGPHQNCRVDDQVRVGNEVKTITIDDLVKQDVRPIIIKLDIEGSEIAALEGAGRTIAGGSDCVIIYEDHGNDPSSRVTDWFIGNTTFEIVFVDDEGARHPIRSASEASMFKVKNSRGYNFFAFSENSSLRSCLL